MPDIETGNMNVLPGEISEVAVTPFIAKFVRLVMISAHDSYANFIHEMLFDIRLSHPSRFGFIGTFDLKYEDAGGN
jgi:hypothetical protein